VPKKVNMQEQAVEIAPEPKRKHAGKSPLVAQYRQVELLKAMLDGRPLEQTAIKLGLSPKTAGAQASHIIKDGQENGTYLRILEQRGVTDDFLADKLRAMLDAKAVQFAQHEGEYTDCVAFPALETQRKTLELAHRLRGHLKESSTGGSIEIGLMQMVVQVVRDSSDTP
jgi:hypothetical protein